MRETQETEAATPIESRLVTYAGQTGLDQTTTSPLVAAYRPIFTEARKVIANAAGVAESVRDATCVSEIRQARACRLAIRKVRLAGETVRKAQKANALAYGKAVDAAAPSIRNPTLQARIIELTQNFIQDLKNEHDGL